MRPVPEPPERDDPEWRAMWQWLLTPLTAQEKAERRARLADKLRAEGSESDEPTAA
jgi:hypothetical protein